MGLAHLASLIGEFEFSQFYHDKFEWHELKSFQGNIILQNLNFHPNAHVVDLFTMLFLLF